jgi:hypothetical protein
MDRGTLFSRGMGIAVPARTPTHTSVGFPCRLWFYSLALRGRFFAFRCAFVVRWHVDSLRRSERKGRQERGHWDA